MKIKIAEQSAFCNYSFFIGAAKENIHELNKLEKLEGCCGVKIFMGSSTGNLLVEDVAPKKFDNFDMTRSIALFPTKFVTTFRS